MSRRSRSAEETVSLFPFLAVLLCTMGTLVVVFVLVAQKTSEFDAETPSKTAANNVSNDAANDAANESDVPSRSDEARTLDDEYAAALVRTDAATIDELRSETESLTWFRGELSGVRTRARESLDAQRERLANAEKATAKLLADSSVLQRKLDAIRSDRLAEPGEDAVALQEKIDALDAEIERLQTDAEKLRAKNADANAKRSYAVVPFQGKKGTFRRPIFVECNSRGVFLQPEGVAFEPADFLLAKYPGNPFDSGLRAAAARYLETSGAKTANGETIEPYPLLIVRPGGAEFYYPAVAALASWGDVYGYEFVDDGDEIAYPAPDPVLAQAVREQSQLARTRLAVQLADATSARRAAASFAGNRRFGNGGFGGSFGGGNGSFRNGGGAPLPDTALQARLGGQARLGSAGAKPDALVPGAADATGVANRSANGFGNGFGVDDGAPKISAAAILAADATPLPQYSGQFSQYLTGVPSDVSTGSGTAAASGSGTGADAAFIPNAASVVDATNGVPSGSGATGAVPTSSNAPGSVATSSETTGSVPTGSDATGSVPTGSAKSTDSTSTPFLALLQNSPETSVPTSPDSDASPRVDARQTLGNTAFAAGATGTSDVGTLADSAASSAAAGGATSTRIRPVERDQKTKPDDDVAYSSSQEQRQAIRISDELRRPATSGLERGISVRCASGRLVFPKQPGLRVATTIALDAGTPLSAKETELLDALVFCVKSWGVAGRNMYWAPYLKVDVAPDGDARFNELSEFCRTQGLSIVRSETNDSAN